MSIKVVGMIKHGLDLFVLVGDSSNVSWVHMFHPGIALRCFDRLKGSLSGGLVVVRIIFGRVLCVMSSPWNDTIMIFELLGPSHVSLTLLPWP